MQSVDQILDAAMCAPLLSPIRLFLSGVSEGNDRCVANVLNMLSPELVLSILYWQQRLPLVNLVRLRPATEPTPSVSQIGFFCASALFQSFAVVHLRCMETAFVA